MSVKIYTTTWCHFCKEAKRYFKQNGITFEEINVEKDAKAANEMVAKSGQMGVPVIEINGKVFVGFNKPAIEKALRIVA